MSAAAVAPDPNLDRRVADAQKLAIVVGRGAVAFQAQCAGRMDRVSARKALAEFVGAYTTALAGPYEVDIEAIVREINARSQRELVAKFGPDGPRGRE